jgi:hypothetical protein
VVAAAVLLAAVAAAAAHQEGVAAAAAHQGGAAAAAVHLFERWKAQQCSVSVHNRGILFSTIIKS